MYSDDTLWKVKLLAWTHDPAEKALVLLRDPAGHEGGTVRRLRRLLGLDQLPGDLEDRVREADHWAAALDRPPLPGDGSIRVSFADDPVLVHPLAGEAVSVREGFADVSPAHIKAVSLDHFEGLVIRDGERIDYRKTFLSFWALGPATPAKELGVLWGVLPADTRIPGHSIWDHLDLASAYAGTSLLGSPCLLEVSLGGVQAFLEQARKTSDLWAGSHLMARLSWEAMRTVCEEFGPDAILFPSLRGNPFVEAWLSTEGIPFDADRPWRRLESDANPLFTSCVPNKFIALVPSERVEEVCDRIREATHRFVRSKAAQALRELDPDQHDHVHQQMERHLEGFPQVRSAWVALPTASNNAGVEHLRRCLKRFYPEGVDPRWFSVPAPGAGKDGAVDDRWVRHGLYAASSDLLARVSEASRLLRPFSAVLERGYRCTLCGEREWLSESPEALEQPRGRRAENLWSGARDRGLPVKEGEYLCGLCWLKRMWPQLFALEVREALGLQVRRFVVSTHSMALVTTLRALEEVSEEELGELLEKTTRWQPEPQLAQAALPATMVRRLRSRPEVLIQLARRLPTLFDELGEAGSQEDLECLTKAVKRACNRSPEAYYALVVADGDQLGAWLSGEPSAGKTPRRVPTYGEVFHPAVTEGLAARLVDWVPYLDAPRVPTPAYHKAISTAVGAFGLQVVGWLTSHVFDASLIYSGGDDVMLMCPVAEALELALALRVMYSGIRPEGFEELVGAAWPGDTKQARGYVLLRRVLHPAMGPSASLSAGIVVAHHKAPLQSVLRAARAALQAAKNAGRNGFALVLHKRSGGTTTLVAPWWKDPQRLQGTAVSAVLKLERAFRTCLSRRAAFDLLATVPSAPADSWPGLMASLMTRHQKPNTTPELSFPELAAEVAEASGGDDRLLTSLVTVAEFLSREVRGD